MQMGFEIVEAKGQVHESDAQPHLGDLTERERMIIRFYRQLAEADRVMMVRMLEALVTRTAPHT